ncbi:hypothetical protein EV128_109222 [Rhizobium azibense]|nr:hypothetical protein EV128_109222 [Rhizobium azibense]
MMGDDEFQKQRLRGRSGGTGGKLAPGFVIGEVGSERTQRVLAHAFVGKMLQRGDVIVVKSPANWSRRSSGRMASSSSARLSRTQSDGDFIRDVWCFLIGLMDC